MLLLLAGLLVLVLGAELLIRGATRLALLAGLSPLVIGLTVVAFGTSAPEVAVSVKAALAGQADVALGNVVGSNICNVLFILGISAIVAPLAVSRQLVRLDIPVMVAVALLAWLLTANGHFGRVEGIGFLVLCVIYTATLIHLGRRTPRLDATAPAVAIEETPERPRGGTGGAVVLVVAGLAGLVFGGRWFVGAAVSLARGWGVSELVIGLTIVAAGTSMPEVATSIMATIKGERDLAVGNVVGSSIYNLVAILGLSSVLAGGIPVAPAAVRFDIPVMVAVALVCLPMAITGGRISRWEGALLLLFYGAYVAYLILADAQHAAVAGFSAVMLWFVIPLTVLGLAGSLWYAWRDHRRAKRKP